MNPLLIVTLLNLTNTKTGLERSEDAVETTVAPEVSVGAGYIESKWVAERILLAASASTTLRPVIARIGQVTGGKDGYWKVTEWVPAMIRSSITLGMLPTRSNVRSFFFY